MYETMLTVAANGRRYAWPLPVQVRRTATYCSVAEPESGIHGVGATMDEATSDFYTSLLAFRDVLAKEAELAPHLRQLLAFLASLT
jgi:hypothetical protein